MCGILGSVAVADRDSVASPLASSIDIVWIICVFGYSGQRGMAQRRFPQFMLIFLCALAALREIFFLKKDMDRLRSEFGDSNVIGALPFQH